MLCWCKWHIFWDHQPEKLNVSAGIDVDIIWYLTQNGYYVYHLN